MATDGLKLESETAVKLKQDAYRESEHEGKQEVREAKRSVKEREVQQMQVMRQVQQEHDKSLTELREGECVCVRERSSGRECCAYLVIVVFFA